MNIPTNLYVLKHKDDDVAMVQVNCHSGEIEYVLDVYMPERLPVGCAPDHMEHLAAWWMERAIPNSRRGIGQALRRLNEKSNLSLMLNSYGLSLTDHYWMQPLGKEEYWSERNFYENKFTDQLGDFLTDSEKMDTIDKISKFSPSSSVNGEMKKKWMIRDDIRYLMKVSTRDYGQQSVNELIATKLHERLQWEHFSPYTVENVTIDGLEVPCSLNPLFTSKEYELVSAYQLIKNVKVSNHSNMYEEMIQQAVQYGLQEKEVREQLEYMILTDFILSNTDRHFNNFGFLYHAEEGKFVSMAPIFDTGNALFFDREIIPSGNSLLEIEVTSFRKREVDMLQYVTNRHLVDTEKLRDFDSEAEALLLKYTEMPQERGMKIANTIRQKIEYIELFQKGKKIWKKEQYW